MEQDNLCFAWDKRKIRWAKVILLILTSKRFKYRFRDTIYYALRTYNNTRRYGASDVLLFDHTFADKITKKI
jgi:hypothetical protein